MDIYEYDDIATFLKDSFHQRMKDNSNLSLKSLSNKIGLSSSSAFNQMLRGQRPVPAKFIPLFVKELKLDLNEANYFNELYLKSKSEDSKFNMAILEKMNPKKWRKKIILKLKNIPPPLFFAVRTFLKRNKNADLASLKENFSTLIDPKLLERSFTAIQTEKQSINSQDRVIATSGIPSIKVQDIHQFYLSLAKESLPVVDVEKREYNTYSINIKKEDIPLMKERIRFFFDSFIEEFGNDQEADSTFQIGGYLYPITRETKK